MPGIYWARPVKRAGYAGGDLAVTYEVCSPVSTPTCQKVFANDPYRA